MTNTDIPAKFKKKHGALLRTVELAQLKLQAARQNFEANPDKDYFRRRVSEAEIKIKEAENKLHEVEVEIEEYQDKAERNEAEGNELMSGLMEHFGVDILAELLNKYGPPAHGQQGTPNDVFWGAAMLKDREILYSPAHGDFYEYDSLTGLWYRVTEDKLATELHSLLVDIDRKTVNNGSLVQWSNLAFRNATVRTQRGCREDRQAFMEQKTRHAQVANGVIEFVDGKPVLMPFNPKYKSLFASPIAYNPDAKCPEFEQLIAHLRKDDQSAIQRAAGQFLIGRNLTHRIIVFEGVGNTGKSTLAQIIEAIVGGQACIELRTEHLKGRFEAYRFHQKSLLIGSDVAHDFLLQEGATELKRSPAAT